MKEIFSEDPRLWVSIPLDAFSDNVLETFVLTTAAMVLAVEETESSRYDKGTPDQVFLIFFAPFPKSPDYTSYLSFLFIQTIFGVEFFVLACLNIRFARNTKM